jgi:endonuclease III
MENLKKWGLTVNHVVDSSDSEIKSLIDSVTWASKKSNYIKKTAQILKDQYAGDIPPTLEKLQELPGVGPKMAVLCMQEAWKQYGLIQFLYNFSTDLLALE